MSVSGPFLLGKGTPSENNGRLPKNNGTFPENNGPFARGRGSVAPLHVRRVEIAAPFLQGNAAPARVRGPPRRAGATLSGEGVPLPLNRVPLISRRPRGPSQIRPLLRGRVSNARQLARRARVPRSTRYRLPSRLPAPRPPCSFSRSPPAVRAPVCPTSRAATRPRPSTRVPRGDTSSSSAEPPPATATTSTTPGSGTDGRGRSPRPRRRPSRATAQG